MRTQEKIFKELKLSKKDDRSDDEWIEIMVSNPILIERPILVYNKQAALGRPPEDLLMIL
jgi:arsenate reductase